MSIQFPVYIRISAQKLNRWAKDQHLLAIEHIVLEDDVCVIDPCYADEVNIYVKGALMSHFFNYFNN